MCPRANASSCTLVFALLTLIYSVAFSAELADAFQSTGPGAKQLATTACANSHSIFDDETLASQSDAVEPMMAAENPQIELHATTRRADDARRSIAATTGLHSLVDFLCDLSLRPAVPQRRIDDVNSQLGDFEHSQSPINETRGKPTGQILAADFTA